MGKYLIPAIFVFLLVFGGIYTLKKVTSVSKFLNKNNDSVFSRKSLIEPLYGAFVSDSVLETSVPQEPVAPVIQPKFCLYAPVIFYHHIQSMDTAAKYKQEYLTVEPGTFESHVKYLKSKKYTFISAESLVNAVNNEKTLPSKSIVLMLDDGYSDAYGSAFKVAKDYKVIINVNIITSLVGKGGYLTWDELKEMKKSKLVNFYNHTADHYDVTYLNKDQLSYQVLTAQKLLEENLGKTPKIFTYPSGFYNDIAVSVLKDIGFIGAFGTDSGSSQCDTNVMHLQRLRMGNVSIDNYGF